MARQFWIKSDGKIDGPFSFSEFLNRVADDGLDADDLFSIDRRTWVPPDEFDPDSIDGAAADTEAGSPASDADQPKVDQPSQAASIFKWPPNWAALAAFALSIGVNLVQAATVFYRHARIVGVYYWSQRKAFKVYLSEFVEAMQSIKLRRREIRITSDAEIPGADYSEEGWKVTLPDCCVVCGEKPEAGQFKQARDVEDLFGPFWTPPVALLIALVVWFAADSYWYGFWYFVLIVVAGFALGYRFRGSTPVEIQFGRCSRHADYTRLPRVRQFSDELIILTGHRSVRQQFTEENELASSPTAGAAEWVERPRAEQPPIPLVRKAGATVQPEEKSTLDSASKMEKNGPVDDSKSPDVWSHDPLL